jgi:segregation and condensation protein A
MAEVVKNDQEYSTKKKIAQPPLNLLFNPSLIQRDDVWKIDIVKLLEILLSTLTSSTYKDLRLCGVAILTSTLIHRLKVESIFRLEKIANKSNHDYAQKTGASIEKLPIPDISNLSLPFRKEISYPIALDELISILENMITDLTKPISKSQVQLEPVQIVDFQDYLIKFEKIIDDFENKLMEKLSQRKQLIFNDLVRDMNELEVARYFIAMLYLCMKGKIVIDTQSSDVINDLISDSFGSTLDPKEKQPFRDTDIIIISNNL